MEKQFQLTDSAEVFGAKVHMIKEVITDAHTKGRRKLDIYSDSRLALQALYSLGSQHKAIDEIKNFIKTTGVDVHMHWIM